MRPTCVGPQQLSPSQILSGCATGARAGHGDSEQYVCDGGRFPLCGSCGENKTLIETKRIGLTRPVLNITGGICVFALAQGKSVRN